ncbi:2-amino-4-hydroxy-6-hydroxymethyldihydropteridine diphosphokinase [Gammaproteobacteria bacterium]|nr:2-amino-4-hydroxy-6-hydroxymethyldihydropteridine diphosphokinase [Gammaproteobacteria bacterium]
MNTLWLGLGANLGRPLVTLADAVDRLRLQSDGHFRVSPIYKSAPWGGVEQADFFNCVVMLSTLRSPRECLDWCHELESLAGRERRQRWGPRTLDVDVLLYNDTMMDDPQLTVPHPRIAERAFVLQPLSDLAPWLDVPGQGRVVDLIAKVRDQRIVRMH